VDDGSHAEPPPGIAYVISNQGLGPVRLGMTLEQARQALPPSWRFEHDSDGEGVALVSVLAGEHALMSLHANEDDPGAPIDWTARITGIESFSKGTATAAGVRVGDLLDDAARAYGPVKDIVASEIESRQFVEFERQPEGIDFRIDYSGDFPAGASHTTRYCPGARILAMSTWLTYD
jgi:hypothetical protein